MKLLTLPLLLLVFSGFAQEKEIKVQSKVSSVTVFLSGAQETRSGKVSVPAGRSTIVFTNLPSHINANSVQVSGIDKFTLLSLNVRKKITDKKEGDPDNLQLTDSLELLYTKLEDLQNEEMVLQEEKNMFSSNRRIVSTTGLNIDDLKEISEFTSDRLAMIEKRLIMLSREKIKLSEEIGRIQLQLNNSLSKPANNSGEIVMTILSTVETSSALQLTYFTTQAGWVPFYDIRSEEVNGPVTLAYKSYVYQYTGSEWNNVQLTLSTSSPLLNNNRPVVYPKYINFVSDHPYGNTRYSYGSGQPNQQDYTWTDQTTMAKITQNSTNTEFKIQSAYSIPADGEKYVVEVGNFNFKAAYHYASVPKYGADAFLIAGISDWYEYSLLPATANIFFQGTYVGKTAIDPGVTGDTLDLSLGIDKSVVVERKNITELNSKTTTGSSKKYSQLFEINIRNTKNVPVTIEVSDHIPVSTQKEISVTVDEKSNGILNEQNGIIKWTLQIDPGQTRSVRFGYTVKYPKNYYINNL